MKRNITAASASGNQKCSGTLAARYIVPPFSILDARQGYWQARKRAWLALGIDSGKGRAEGLVFNQSSQGTSIYAFRNRLRKKLQHNPSWDEVIQAANRVGYTLQGQTSIFDPVLCEVIYRWFCPRNGRILDPFAGGSVRGIVAGILGRAYVVIDLRRAQVVANERQAKIVRPVVPPRWVIGDSLKVASLAKGQYDLMFSCPPYADLEVYSRDPRDLSTMDYPHFLRAYREIIMHSAALLRPNRFACFVVGDIRDHKGHYRNFPGDTIAAFHAAGLSLYNEAILTTALGSLPIRVSAQFSVSRKLGKAHQNVLVFVKGDPKAAAAACGSVCVDGGPESAS